MRIVNLVLIVSLVGLAFLIYQVKNDTRGLQEQVASLRLDIKKERDAIEILRAEWSHLNRPERLERLARKHLGLEPLQARQMVTIDKITPRTPGAPAKRVKPLARETAPALRYPVSAVR